jgi:hypothetical protein
MTTHAPFETEGQSFLGDRTKYGTYGGFSSPILDDEAAD